VGLTIGADSLLKSIKTSNGLANTLLYDQTLPIQLKKLIDDLSSVLADVKKDPPRYMKGAIQVRIF
jgi:hypothetical protein